MTVNTTVTVRVPAKVNLQLAVGPGREDGFHDLVNVFHAVSLFDEVTVTAAPSRPETTLTELSVGGGLGSHLSRVPLDETNLAARAVALLAARTGRGHPVTIHMDKHIPVAGGMAGGSADAAAALVACDRLWGCDLPRRTLFDYAAELGSDVPFALMGATAVGRGRGELLEPMAGSGRFHWVFALSPHGLSTAAVFAEYDRLRPDAPAPRADAALATALADADPVALGRSLGNDLEAAALSLLPELERTLALGREAGALGALVSGSGPTCAFLVGGGAEERSVIDRREAAVVAALEASGLCEQVVTAYGDVPGATVL
ncbi:4-diphosphocytidyl-2-C-methyl-D-erythritol kinase [Nocardiopsis sp. Huas11]|uniref:4-(cytidine 5'-diphospho)-2-C-methyl-D-erythritol kinase n=1 Tax=Nocardiopsis sp. Huas11 TaxID=2183912 RepID=UPI000EB2AFD0|nr:4-(cytidine 5'-diphospho)-2-C-methyl-D-erythritol kinase [Nocardiopsis sp. Huas11]RKS05625.1 4-diphosphocytidyl-2-C-methyl-D-erythritol kinase [Nocardiopsis sp. Huas11]